MNNIPMNEVFKNFILILAGSILVLSIASLFSSLKNNDAYSRKDATGFKVKEAASFFYFYETLNLYPLTTHKHNELKKLKIKKKRSRKIYNKISHKFKNGEKSLVSVWRKSPYFGIVSFFLDIRKYKRS